MPDWVTNGPLGLAVAFMFGVVFTRAQATYWIGRAIGEGAMRVDASVERTGVVVWFARHLRGDRMDSAVVKLRRYGGPIITFSFLTVGFQTFANAAAGIIRMRWPVYTAWMFPGCIAWAVIYSVGGLAVWAGLMHLATKSPWALVAVLLITGGAIAFRIGRRRRRIVGPAEQTSQ